MEHTTITLPESGQEVDIKSALTWYDYEYLESALAARSTITKPAAGAAEIRFAPDSLLQTKLDLFKRAIIGIRSKDGTPVPYSQEWVEALPYADGKAVADAVDALKKK